MFEMKKKKPPRFPVGTTVGVPFERWIGVGKVARNDPPSVLVQGKTYLDPETGEIKAGAFWEARRPESQVYRKQSEAIEAQSGLIVQAAERLERMEARKAVQIEERFNVST